MLLTIIEGETISKNQLIIYNGFINKDISIKEYAWFAYISVF